MEHKPKLYPLLIGLIEEFKKINQKIGLTIEIKSTLEEEKNGYQPNYKIFTDIVIEVVKALPNPKPQIMFQSFDWRVIDYLHQKYPEYQTVALIEEPYNYKKILSKLKRYPSIFSPDYMMLNAKEIKYFQSLGVKVIPWVVNTTEEMTKLMKMGVDGIITDYPNLIPASNAKITK